MLNLNILFATLAILWLRLSTVKGLVCNLPCTECVTDGDTCTACDLTASESYLHETGNKCLTACPVGTFIVGAKLCKDCHSTCETCDGEGANDCLTCDSGGGTPVYYKTERTCNAAGVCPDGTYADGSTCKNCHTTCKTCDGATATDCLTCETTDYWFGYYYAANKQCVREVECPTNTYRDGGQQCLSCHGDCATCSGPTNSDCLSCPSSKYLKTGGTGSTATDPCVSCAQTHYLAKGECVNSTDCIGTPTPADFANDNTGYCEDEDNTTCDTLTVTAANKKCHKWLRWCASDCGSFSPPTPYKILEGSVSSQQFGVAGTYDADVVSEQMYPGSVPTQDTAGSSTTKFETFEGCLWTIDGVTLYRYAIDTFWDGTSNSITTQLGAALQSFDVGATAYNGSHTITTFVNDAVWWNPWANEIFFPLQDNSTILTLQFANGNPCEDMEMVASEKAFTLNSGTFPLRPVYYNDYTFFYIENYDGTGDNKVIRYESATGTKTEIWNLNSAHLTSMVSLRDVGILLTRDDQTGIYQHDIGDAGNPAKRSTYNTITWKLFQTRPGRSDTDDSNLSATKNAGKAWRPVYAVQDSGANPTSTKGNLWRITNEIQEVYTDTLGKFNFIDQQTDLGRFRMGNFGQGNCEGNLSAQYAHITLLCLGNPEYQICDCLDLITSGCGDLVHQDGEACDDGNTKSGDGCSATCTVELGWSCPTTGDCHHYCPNTADEYGTYNKVCDDGNNTNGDGCSDDCKTVENLWWCSQRTVANSGHWGQACDKCGDGSVNTTTSDPDYPEVCDEGPTPTDAAGCLNTCTEIETGYECPAAGGECVKQCGDGTLDSSAPFSEVCDDGNETDGDGCSADCKTIEDGYYCPTPGSACIFACGNALITTETVAGETGAEVCDDSNTTAGDGCSANCREIEEGYQCPTEGAACEPKCSSEVGGVYLQALANWACYNGQYCNATCEGILWPGYPVSTHSATEGYIRIVEYGKDYFGASFVTGTNGVTNFINSDGTRVKTTTDLIHQSIGRNLIVSSGNSVSMISWNPANSMTFEPVKTVTEGVWQTDLSSSLAYFFPANDEQDSFILVRRGMERYLDGYGIDSNEDAYLGRNTGNSIIDGTFLKDGVLTDSRTMFLFRQGVLSKTSAAGNTGIAKFEYAYPRSEAVHMVTEAVVNSMASLGSDGVLYTTDTEVKYMSPTDTSGTTKTITGPSGNWKLFQARPSPVNPAVNPTIYGANSADWSILYTITYNNGDGTVTATELVNFTTEGYRFDFSGPVDVGHSRIVNMIIDTCTKTLNAANLSLLFYDISDTAPSAVAGRVTCVDFTVDST
eukprot:CAMPEP_0114986614 /NCGR_PEP_ID=MMETSP0216-20121206/8525_1 /TAXON_ID=223996 /ORGANISM="Protocruzia adherens, Strain Boccale" /LENGTH=1320 /DNA_ID=CAMNT_0002349071 /DNA_START=266 /DNA_END=4228 /DNA_ORIENTATION=-